MTAYFPIFFPLGCAAIAAALSGYLPRAAKFLGFAGASLGLVALFTFNKYTHLIPNAADSVSITIAVFIAFFATLASLSAVKEEENPWFYVNLLISAAFAMGAVLTDNFLMMLVFWEGLLITLYLFLLPYNKETANKAFLINAAGDIALLAGICLLYAAGTGTLVFGDAALTDLKDQGVWAFILIFTGAVAKAGAFPFHNWIAPAAKNASFTFMAMLPAAIEKLLAVFLLGKIFTQLFPILPFEARAYVCILAIITIAAAAARMLIFKDLKELLAWSIVMQIGLLMLALGVRVVTEADILYVMNHGIFKAALLGCAFFAAGALSQSYGGLKINDLRGAAKTDMGLFIILAVCALGLAGLSLVDIAFIPNTLLADAYAFMPLLAAVPAAAALITIFTFGKILFAMAQKTHKKPAPAPIFRAITAAAFIPVLFFTLGFEFDPYFLLGIHFAGWGFNTISIVCIVLLLCGLLLAVKVEQPKYGFKKDTYDYIKAAIYRVAGYLFTVDRVMDKVFDAWPSAFTRATAKRLSKQHRGSTPQYIVWAVLGIIAFVLMAIQGVK